MGGTLSYGMVNLRWDIEVAAAAGHSPSIASLIAAGYDEQIIERQVGSGPSATWVEITRASTRPPLVESHVLYVYCDRRATAMSTVAWRIRFRRSSDGAIHATPCIDVTPSATGYCTVQDIRDQGFTETLYSDTMVRAGIDRASSLIEKVCRQWFEPRFMRKIVDGRGHDRVFLDIAVCTIMQAAVDDADMTPATDIVISNRHLTRGQLQPDDRMNPFVGYALAEFSSSYERRQSFSQFGSGRHNVTLVGVFGCTELMLGDECGEYSAQVPLSYGSTPSEIRRACMLLTIRFMQTVAGGGGDEFLLRNRVISESTRDQSYSLASPGGDDGAYGMTGDTEVDNLLMLFPPPLQVTTV